MTTRPTLPQYYGGGGEIIDDFESTSGYSPIYGMVFAEDTVNFKTGTKSLNLQVASADYMPGFDKTLSTPVTIPADTVFGMWMYIPNNVLNFHIYMSSVAPFSTSNPFFDMDFTAYYPNYTTGWNYVRWAASAMTAHGGASWLLPMQSYRIRFSGSPAVNVSLDSLQYGIRKHPCAVVTFDDAYDDAYTVAYPIMSPLGIPGTIFATKAKIDDGGEMITIPHMAELYDAGWDICTHGMTHADMSTLTDEENIAQITGCQDWLNGLGFTRSAGHLAYPSGGYDAEVIAIMRQYCLSGWGISTASVMNWPNINNYSVERLRLYESVALSTLKQHIDTARATGGTIAFYTHDIRADCSTAGITPEKFETVMRYLEASHIPCRTVAEWYNGLTNPRYRSLPVTRATV